MTSMDQRSEIDNHTMKLIVGVIALSLAYLTDRFSLESLTSISASYWDEGPWAGTIFVGFLFAIGAFLLSYNGKRWEERWLSKVAALAAISVAMFPCACDGHVEIIPKLHYIAAAVMFGILAAFCYFFYKRANAKGWAQARLRGWIYLVCGLLIALAMLGMLVNHFTGEALTNLMPRFTFYAEATGLVAFGVAWMTASRILPYITSSDERLSLL